MELASHISTASTHGDDNNNNTGHFLRSVAHDDNNNTGHFLRSVAHDDDNNTGHFLRSVAHDDDNNTGHFLWSDAHGDDNNNTGHFYGPLHMMITTTLNVNKLCLNQQRWTFLRSVVPETISRAKHWKESVFLLPACLPVCFSVCLSVRPSIHPSIRERESVFQVLEELIRRTDVHKIKSEDLKHTKPTAATTWHLMNPPVSKHVKKTATTILRKTDKNKNNIFNR